MATRDDIVRQRAEWEGRKYPQFWVHYRNLRFMCFALPQELYSALPHFALQMVADDATEHDLYHKPIEIALFAVCDSIPERWRFLPAYHEMAEYIGGYTCAQATIQEMNAFMNGEGMENMENLRRAWEEYLPYRQNFFSVLPAYALKNRYSAQKIEEFQRSDQIFRSFT